MFFIIEMKNISFKVDKELHKAIKIRATEQYMDIKEYILELIKKDLEENRK